MIEMQVIKENNKPVAVILDYQEYIRLKEIEQDVEDYNTAVEIKATNKKWIKHEDLKKELDL
jgi:PHD/YefM family antitoxin component YafN of YafNO toxin-antitoxin module